MKEIKIKNSEIAKLSKAYSDLFYVRNDDKNYKYVAETISKANAIIDTFKSGKQYSEITAELERIQKRCTARTITADEIIKAITKAYDRLSFCTIDERTGCKFTVNLNAQKFPKAYKYTADATYFDFEFTKSGVSVTLIYRDECSNNRCVSELTELAKESISRNYVATII